MMVKEIARSGVWVLPSTSIKEAARKISEGNNIALLVKTTDDEFMGVFSYVQLSEAVAQGDVEASIEQYVDTEPTFVMYDADVVDALRLMKKFETPYLVVLNEDEEPYAVVMAIDVIKAITPIIENLLGE